MHISGESLLVILLVGLVAGWLAGKIVDGSGFGLIGDMAIGIVGALIGSWLMTRLGIPHRQRNRVVDYRRHHRRSHTARHCKARDGRLSAASLVAIVETEMAAGCRTSLRDNGG